MSEDIDALASQTHDVSSGRERRAELCIRNHVIAAMGCALIPSFIIDVAVVTGIEVKMIRDLAAIYDFPVPRKLVAYKLLLSLIGSQVCGKGRPAVRARDLHRVPFAYQRSCSLCGRQDFSKTLRDRR